MLSYGGAAGLNSGGPVVAILPEKSGDRPPPTTLKSEDTELSDKSRYHAVTLRSIRFERYGSVTPARSIRSDPIHPTTIRGLTIQNGLTSIWLLAGIRYAQTIFQNN